MKFLRDSDKICEWYGREMKINFNKKCLRYCICRLIKRMCYKNVWVLSQIIPSLKMYTSNFPWLWFCCKVINVYMSIQCFDLSTKLYFFFVSFNYKYMVGSILNLRGNIWSFNVVYRLSIHFIFKKMQTLKHTHKMTSSLNVCESL